MTQNGLQYGRNFNDRDKEVVLKVLERDNRDPLFFVNERPDDWIFPTDFQDYLSPQLKKDWIERSHSMNFEKKLCLKTPANTDNVKCYGCGSCESAEHIKFMTKRPVESEHSYSEVMNLLAGGSKSVTGVRVVVKVKPGWDMYAKKSLSHYITAQFIKKSAPVDDGLESTVLSKAFYCVGKSTCSWFEANGFRSYVGGTYAFDIELRERVPLKTFTDLIEEINKEATVFQILAVHNNDGKQMSIKIDSKVSCLAYTNDWSVAQLKDKISMMDSMVKKGIKSMGGREITNVELPEFKESLVISAKGNMTLLYFTAPLSFNPYLLLSTITGKSYEQMLKDFRVDVVDNFVESMVTCPKCSNKLGISYFTGELQKVCHKDYGKILLAKLSGSIK